MRPGAGVWPRSPVRPGAALGGALLVAGLLLGLAARPEPGGRGGAGAGPGAWAPAGATGGPAAGAPAPAPGGGSPGALAAALAMGRAGAPVTVEVFSDFRCRACARLAQEILPRLSRSYVAGGQVRIRYRLYPILSAASVLAARAAACAAEQGRFWPFHDALYAEVARAPAGRLPAWDARSLRRVALAVGLDPARYGACWRSRRPTEAVQADVELGKAWRVREVPTLVIGPAYLAGEPSWEAVERAVRQALGAGGRGAAGPP